MTTQELTGDQEDAQVLTIDEVYGYLWRGTELLTVGDRVELPGKLSTDPPWEGTVTELGNDYIGWMRYVIRKL